MLDDFKTGKLFPLLFLKAVGNIPNRHLKLRNNNIFQLPMIQIQGEKRIVDMELFVQLFFVGQDGKDTSTIFNSGFYHKDDSKNMLLSIKYFRK